MTAKRFEVVMNEFDEVEYIMDKEMMEDRDFAEFIDFVEDVCKENEYLKQRNKRLEYKIQRERNSFRKTHERWSKEAEDKIKELSEENEVCKEAYKEIKSDAIRLRNKNEQLQARNDRQAKRLDRLYQLISQKDWRTLSDILDDFKRCEEQLQREWRAYE